MSYSKKVHSKSLGTKTQSDVNQRYLLHSPAASQHRFEDLTVEDLSNIHTASQKNQLKPSAPRFRGLAHELIGDRQGITVQAKLAVNPSGDRYEKEADQVADQVVRQINNSISPILNSRDDSPKQPIMRKADTRKDRLEVSSDFEASLKKELDQGQPLNHSIRQPMEQAFGARFDGVRVHTTDSSDTLSQSIRAEAFTTGKDIFFRHGKYQPNSLNGQKLLAHELTHVIQQSSNLASRSQNVVQRKVEETELFSKKKINKNENTSKDTSLGSSGYYTRTTEKKSTSYGAEASAKKIIESNGSDFKVACEMLSKAGFFESTKKTTSTHGLTTERSRESFLGGEFKGKVTVQVMDVIDGIKILAEASAKEGSGQTLSGQLAKSSGNYELLLKGKLDTFIGFQGSAKGELKLNILDGLVLDGKAEAKFGAMATANSSAQFTDGDVGYFIEGEANGFAGVEASAKGKVVLGPSGVAASGGAEVFAGIKGSGKVSGGITTKRGTRLVKVSAKGSVSTGIGASAKGNFQYINGQLSLGTTLGGTLGLGAGVEGELTIDITEIKKVLMSASSDSTSVISLASKIANERPCMPDSEAESMKSELHKALYTEFYNYAFNKAKDKSAKHYVKRSKAQQIIADKVGADDRLAELIWYKESDEVLRKMAYEATSRACEAAGKPTLKAKSENSFTIKRGLIIFWPYTE